MMLHRIRWTADEESLLRADFGYYRQFRGFTEAQEPMVIRGLTREIMTDGLVAALALGSSISGYWTDVWGPVGLGLTVAIFMIGLAFGMSVVHASHTRWCIRHQRWGTYREYFAAIFLRREPGRELAPRTTRDAPTVIDSESRGGRDHE